MLLNWLLIAGLPIDPAPGADEARAAAARCRKRWAAKANDQRKGPYYRTLLDQADDMERALGNEAERARMAKEAQGVVYPALDASLRLAAGGGRVVPAEKLDAVARVVGKRIEREQGIRDVALDAAFLEARAARLGMAVERGGGQDRARRAYETFGKPDPAQDAAFKADVQLALYGARDLYEFACPPGCDDPRSALGADLVRRADELAGSYRLDRERKTTIETLAQKAKDVFGSREKRRRYDAYLVRRAVGRVLDDLRERASLADGVVDGLLAREAADAIRPLLGKDAAEAPYVVEGFCRAQRPPLLLRREGAGAEAAAAGAPGCAAAPSGAGGPEPHGAAQPAGRASAARPAPARVARPQRPSGPLPAAEPVVIEDAAVANGDVAVRIRPPAAATGFVVLTRPDRFARSLSDANAAGLQTRHEIPRAVYERDGALVLPDARRLGCFVTVFAEYRADGQVRYSEGADWQVKPPGAGRIPYRVEARRRPFRAPRVTVVFDAPAGPFQLPEALVAYGQGSLPLAAEGAPVAARIPAQRVDGALRVEVPGLPNARDLYVRVFPAAGPADAFALAPGSSCKVS